MSGVTAPQRGDIWWVSLDPTQGAEIKKTRPCLVLTTNILNQHRQTVIVIPYSSAARAYPPLTVPVMCQGKKVVAVVDQLRAIAKHRLQSKIDTASRQDIESVEKALAEILELP